LHSQRILDAELLREAPAFRGVPANLLDILPLVCGLL
jgi:hypothetical protein